jgi:hypothetical protein
MSANPFKMKNLILGVVLGLIIACVWLFYPQIKEKMEDTYQAVHEESVEKAKTIPKKIADKAAQKAEAVVEKPKENLPEVNADVQPEPVKAGSKNESEALIVDAEKQSSGEPLAAIIPVEKDADESFPPKIQEENSEFTEQADNLHFFRFFESNSMAVAYLNRWKEATGEDFVLRQEADMYMIYFRAAADEKQEVLDRIKEATGLEPVEKPVY